MYDEGYIKIARRMLNWEWFSSSDTTHLFLALLLMANWEDGKFKGLDVRRGQVITTYDALSRKTGLTVSKIRTSLKRLEKTGEISRKIAGKSQLITVENYASYQSSSLEDDRKLASTSQDVDRMLTGFKEERKERSKEKKEECQKNIYICSSKGRAEKFDKFWAAYPKKKGKGAALKAWEKLNPSDELIEMMLSAVEQQKGTKEWVKDAGQFIPYPATWLNGRRWEDEADSQEGFFDDEFWHRMEEMR